MTTSKKCEFCDKRGLPLLLVRDAVAPAKSGAPVVDGLAIDLPPTIAHYTKRLLRSGYVNVYDEARRRWDCYFVTPESLFYKLALTSANQPPIIPTGPFSCNDRGHRELANCITISDPVNATTVWIGFSDVLWTDPLRKANENRDYRKRHMVELDVQRAIHKPDAQHPPVQRVEAVVAEYSLPSPRIKPILDSSPFGYCARFGFAEQLVKQCDCILPGKGMIVTVPDPAGIVQEIAFMMAQLVDSFIEKDPVQQRNLAACTAIDQIRGVVTEQAEADTIISAHTSSSEMEAANPLGYLLSESTRRENSRLREVNAGELDRAGAAAWEKYKSKFNESVQQAWKKKFEDSLKAYNDEYIAPLAICHARWFKHPRFVDYFRSNYDPLNISCGAVYTAVVTRCLGGTQDKAICSRLYSELLGGVLSDEDNVLLRAAILNHSPLANEIERASRVSIDSRQIPWDAVFLVYSKAVKTLSENAGNVLASYITQISGPVAKVIGKVVDGGAGFHKILMLLGVIAGDRLVIVEVAGKRSQFVRHLAKEIIRMRGHPLSENQLKKALSVELQRLQIRGVRVDGERKLRWVIALTPQVAPGSVGNGSHAAQISNAASSLRTIEELERLRLDRWRLVINQNVGWGVVTGILQAVCLTKIYQDEGKTLANESHDTSWRRVAGVSSLIGTTCELIGSALEARALQGLRLGQGMIITAAKFLQFIGRAVGAAAGILIAVLDFLKAWEVSKEGGSGLLIAAYAGSGILGFGLALAIMYSASLPVLLVIVVLLVAVGLVIEFLRDNPLQDWLERCPWGSLVNQRYASMKIEQEQLVLALK